MATDLDATHTAFFYGTLMAPGVLHRVIHGTPHPDPWQVAKVTVRPALLQHHRRARVVAADYPGIVARDGASVRGTLVTGLTDMDLRRLDIFEGSQYARVAVRVQVLRDTALLERVDEAHLADHVECEAEAQTYLWVQGEEYLEGTEWDFDEFKREKLGAWTGTGQHEEADEGFADVERWEKEQGGADPTGGRGLNGHITKQLEAEKS